MKTYSYGLREWALLAAAVLLGACAAVPADRPAASAVAAPQPLQRLDIAPDPRQRDLIANLLAGELALVDADAATAAQRYADAAQASEDAAIAEQATHIAIAGRQWEAAHAALLRWQALHGDEVGVRQARAMLALHAGADDAAFLDLAWLVRRPGGSGWRAVSQALLGAENKTAAGLMFERLLRGEGAKPDNTVQAVDLGNDAQVWIAVGQIAMRLDRGDIAKTLAQRAIERFHTPETYAWAAQVKIGAGDKDGARKLFADALRSAKSAPGAAGREDNARLRVAYAALLGDLGDYAQASAVLAEGPQNDRVYAARAAYLAHGDAKANRAQIETLYRQVLAESQPRPPMRLLLLGQLSELAERSADALKWYAEVGEGEDEWFDAQQRTAILLHATGRAADAMSLLHELEARVADEAKSLGEVFLLEAELSGGKGKSPADAIAVYDRGLQALPDDTRLLYARALACESADRVDDAIRDLRRVLELKPDNADALNALGYTLADRTDKKTEALALIEKALKLKPGEPAIIDSMGWVQYRLGNLEAAVEQLRSAYAKQRDPEIAAHLGEVLWVSGRKDEARQVWEEGRKKDAGNKVLLETIKRLAS
ncbi:tetratricopeptide repeat protein [Rudaea sp.]|uniref:tetratricopeptide repeat protein n=1 Tax=Rudaea sp. TaxID=2136325 RepID=UPI00321FEB99